MNKAKSAAPRPAAPTAGSAQPKTNNGRPPVNYEGTLIAEGLTKSYRNRRVVNGVSLVVRQGEAVGLLGPNGKEE